MIKNPNKHASLTINKIWCLLYNHVGEKMETKRLNKEDFEEALAIVRQGGTVAFKTDTVFGLGVRYDCTEAIKKLKAAKGRPESKPFPMMVSSIEQLKKVAVVHARDEQIIRAFMPGALTMIFKKREAVSDEVTNGFDTIAIRMPDDEFILRLIDELGVPMLVTSANISGETAALDDVEALRQLDGRIDAVVKGKSGGSTASTILDVSTEKMCVLRQGELTLAEIERVLNDSRTALN